MPSSSTPPPTPPVETTKEINGSGGGGATCSIGGRFELDESAFLASLMPKEEIGAKRFLEAHPDYDGKGVLIAIFDSGVDPAASGLQVTSDGKPKILDILDCTGSGDVDTSRVVKADSDGYIVGATGERLLVNSSWNNPSQEWHVGCKLVYELFVDSLTSRVKKDRRKKWDEKNQEAIFEVLKELNDFDMTHAKIDDSKLKRTREDLQNMLDFLKTEAESYDDRGPIIDIVVWNDGDVWRVAVDTQSLEDGSGSGKLADFVPLTNYRIERKYGMFSKLDACSFVTNVYDEGNLVSIVTDCSPHGTHVAGIAAAFHPEEPLLNGVAPGAQLISCKIGDARLGSMETGTGLIRALIAAAEHKCDIINMSYGEATMLPDYGRFVELVDEAVNKLRLIFISSAGNSGPALSTVGSPGGTTSSIIGIGAYVSPAMAAGAHSVVEPPSKGLEYTWSSRGPTVDGDLGVCLSAPGGAVAPVPTWTLQRRMLMNGTSMSSPCACGGVALLVSAMKAEGIPVSPYIVRKALENTTVTIGDALEDKLSTGHGLMQVDRAHEYVRQCMNLPAVCYRVKISQVGKTALTLRGIYLRCALSCEQSSEWTVEVDPKFHDDANNLEELVPFEEHIQLHSTDVSVVRVPEYLLLTHNGRNFNVVVDPTNLSSGLHYHEVYGTDCKAPWRGVIFRVPITIIKPISPIGQPPVLSFSDLSFFPGHVERIFIDVPTGCTWAVATMQISGFDTPRRFFIDTLQISPLKRPIKWETVLTFSSPSLKSFTFPVKGGLTMELALAQFWSSGIGSHEMTKVCFKIVFHGINTDEEEVVLDGSEAPRRIDAYTLVSCEKLAPEATLSKLQIPYRPIDSRLKNLCTKRDKLPSGKQIFALLLTYKFKLEEGSEIKPHVPLLNNRVYDTIFESQFYVISDTNKRVFAVGDVYPKFVKVPRGDYTLHLYLRHDNIELLDKMKQIVLFIERKLHEKDHIKLNFFSQPDGHVTSNGTFKDSILAPGERQAFYVGPPHKEMLPKNSSPGAVLLGSISYGTAPFESNKDDKIKAPVSYPISFVIHPKVNVDKGKDSNTSFKSVSEQVNEEVRDAKIKVLASLKRGTEDELIPWNDFSASLKMEYPKYTPLLAKILEGLLSGGPEVDKISRNKEIINAANEVVESVDREELAKYFSVKPDDEDEEFEKIRRKMEGIRDFLAEALFSKGFALAEIETLEVAQQSERSKSDVANEPGPDHSDLFEENLKELKKWVDVKSSKYSILLVIQARRSGRIGTALKILRDMIEDDKEPPKKKLYDLKVELLNEIGWAHVASHEKQWMHVRFPSSLPLF